MTKTEEILNALSGLADRSGGQLPPAPIDEPAAMQWSPVSSQGEGEMRIRHRAGIMSATPKVLNRCHGGEGETTYELEMEATVLYGVVADRSEGGPDDECRTVRRAMRDQVIELVRDLIADDRTLGLDVETWAELGPVEIEDTVTFPDGAVGSTAMIPVITLFTATSAAG